MNCLKLGRIYAYSGYSMAEFVAALIIVSCLGAVALLHVEIAPASTMDSQITQLISHLHLAKMTAINQGMPVGLEFAGWNQATSPLNPYQYRFIDVLGNPVTPKGLMSSTFSVDQDLTHGLPANIPPVHTYLSADQNPIMFDRMGRPSQFNGTETEARLTLTLRMGGDANNNSQTLTLLPQTGSVTIP